jgi:hypothetical protein
LESGYDAAIGLLICINDHRNIMSYTKIFRFIIFLQILLLTGCYTLINVRPQRSVQHLEDVIDKGLPLPVVVKDQCLYDTTKLSPPDPDSWIEYRKMTSPDKFFSKQAVPIYRVYPQSPSDPARSDNINVVLVKAYVDSVGDVTCACIAKNDSNFQPTTPILRAMIQWKFSPAQSGEKPVGVWIYIPFRIKFQRYFN